MQLILATLLLLAAPKLELELAPGIALSNDALSTAPSLRARVGAELPWFTPSLVLFGTASSDPGPYSHFNQGGGLQAWAIAAEARVHNNGSNQFALGIGVGWGRLIVAQQANGDLATYHGQAAPYVEVMLGYRHRFEDFSLGIDATVHTFNRVEFLSDVDGGQVGGSQVLGLALSLGL